MVIPNFNDMIVTLAANMPNLMRLTTALSYVLGIVLMGNGLYGFKQYGDMRTMQSSSNDFRGPATMVVVAALLLYFPSTVYMGVTTFWGEPNILPYQPEEGTAGDTESIVLTAIFDIVQVVGAISFVRGLTLLSRAGKGQQQGPGNFGKGVSHCIAGVLGINVYATWQMLLASFGIFLN